MREVAQHSPGEGILPGTAEGLGLRAGGAPLLEGVDLLLAGGGITVVLGPNGAGKSLLLRLLHGLLPPTEGTVRWNGRPPDRAVRRRQAMVFQKPVLLRRSAAANVRYALRVQGRLSRAERRRRTAEVLEQAGLAPLARRPARVLSGGEQQRLALARAWAVRPEVLFLDEATTNLDPQGAQAVEALVGEIRRRGTKVIAATHDLGQARRLADEVVFLHRGHPVERGPAPAFFESPASEQARAFLAGELVL